MAINKVVYGDQTLVDLTSDTATAEDVAQGKTFHDASGQQRTGSNTGSGGHIIQNAAGTDLAQESKLQFGGMLKATDDSTNGVTKVSDLAEEVDWSVWNAMTEAQRTAYSAGKKLDIINVPSVSGSIPVELIKTLWTNPNPSEAFAAQTITLNSNDYDFLLILANFSNTVTDTQATAILAKSQGIYLNGSHTGSSAFGVARRWIKHDSDTSLIVEDAYSATSSSAAQTMTDGRIIPTAIYGIKSSVNVDMSALVANVSTSASKCMLSDGETSVEDALNNVITDLQNPIDRETYEDAVSLEDGIYPITTDDNTIISSDMVKHGNGTVEQALDFALNPAPTSMANIDLSQFTIASGNKYVFPSNGYVWASVPNGTKPATVHIYAKDGASFTYVQTTYPNIFLLPVYKGMMTAASDFSVFRFIKFNY